MPLTPRNGCSPTASHPEKAWPAAHFITLIDDMAKRYPADMHVILAGLADWEQQQAAAILAGVGERPNVNLLPAGPDDDAFIKSARLLVANDTGMRHLGIALGTPTVGIFFSAPPFRY